MSARPLGSRRSTSRPHRLTDVCPKWAARTTPEISWRTEGSNGRPDSSVELSVGQRIPTVPQPPSRQPDADVDARDDEHDEPGHGGQPHQDAHQQARPEPHEPEAVALLDAGVLTSHLGRHRPGDRPGEHLIQQQRRARPVARRSPPPHRLAPSSRSCPNPSGCPGALRPMSASSPLAAQTMWLERRTPTAGDRPGKGLPLTAHGVGRSPPVDLPGAGRITSKSAAAGSTALKRAWIWAWSRSRWVSVSRPR
jgi:hypothetical protein